MCNGKGVPVCAMKVHGGSGGVATYILNLDIRWTWV